MTELALHPTVANFTHTVNIIPENVNRVSEATRLATTHNNILRVFQCMAGDVIHNVPEVKILSNSEQ